MIYSNPNKSLVELLQSKREWRVLVLADRNIHIAMDISPLVSHVTLVCPTDLQAQQAEEAIFDSRLSNIATKIHDLEDLPYAEDSFDLLICHHMAHNIRDLETWLLEADRILCPRGRMAVAAITVPGTRLRGKKARKLGDAADYINAFNRLGNPRHHNYYSQNGWEDLLIAADLHIQKLETTDNWVDLAEWADETVLTAIDRLRLKVMLVQAPEKAGQFLTPQFSGDRIRFRLPEITILAISKANTD